MMNNFVMSYSLLKALHLIFMVTWFAGLFYIFRLFVYHVREKDKPEITRIFETMEKKLIWYIMNPSLALALGFGVALLMQNPDLLTQRWFLAKLVLVFLLIAYHSFAMTVRRRFLYCEYFLSETACRVINEIPSLVLVGVILLAILKPWGPI